MNPRTTLFLVFALTMSACGSSNKLAEYDFNGSTLALVEAIRQGPTYSRTTRSLSM